MTGKSNERPAIGHTARGLTIFGNGFIDPQESSGYLATRSWKHYPLIVMLDVFESFFCWTPDRVCIALRLPVMS